jgi:chromosomal replication initiation ATPase DnaA
MATGSNVLEDSLGSPLDYDAEVAYISATSPKPREELKQSTSKSSLRDFEFSSGNDVTPTPSEATAKPGSAINKMDAALENHVHGTKEKTLSPHSLTLMNDPKLRLQPSDKEKLSLSPPARVQAAHYTLDTEATLPGTPKSRLRQIKEAQESPLTATKQQKFKFGESQYKTLVVHGTTGCGRTHLAQKLVHSNPAVFAKVISSTTRKRRPSELDGVDFHFVSHEEMSSGIVRGDFLEYIQVR